MKTKSKIYSLWVILLAGIFTMQTQAQNKTTFSIETDPSTFVFKGYALHFRIKPQNSQHWVWGGGTYALDLPNLLVAMNTENKDKGWQVRINSAYSFFSEYYLQEANKNWFIGLQVGIQNYKIKNENFANQESKYSNLLLMPSVGYNWQVFKFPLYIKPWLGLGYTTKISGNNTIENLNYSISPLIPFLTLHIGYTF